MPNRADELLQRLNRYGAQGDTLAVILRYLLQQEGKRAEDDSVSWFSTAEREPARGQQRQQADAFFGRAPAALPSRVESTPAADPAALLDNTSRLFFAREIEQRNASFGRNMFNPGPNPAPSRHPYAWSSTVGAAIARAPISMNLGEARDFFRANSNDRPFGMLIEDYAHECATAYMREPTTRAAQPTWGITPPTVTMPQGWRLEISERDGAYVAVPDQADLAIEAGEEPDHD